MKSQISRIRTYAYVIAVSWTFLLLSFFAWIYAQQRENVLSVARAEARMALEKDALYSRWSAEHGGTYVAVTHTTPPSHSLSQLPERDIVTPSGRKLTLVSPAYMTRQVFELAEKQQSTVRAHITSLNPIRPENAPDPWERKALKAFQRGAEEVSAVETMGGLSYMRLMQPFVTEKGCLQCHAVQGYNVGDARGGISVAVSLNALSGSTNRLIARHAVAYLFIWTFGLVVLEAGRRALCKSVCALEESEERYRMVADYTSDWEYWIGADGRFRYMSASCRDASGYSQEEFYRDPELLVRIIHPEDRHKYDRHLHDPSPPVAPAPVDFRIITAAGEIRWISHLCRTVYTTDGKPNGRRASNRDITDRKIIEAAVVQSEEKFSKSFYNAPMMMSISDIDDGTYLDVNRKFTEMSGIPRHEAIGQTFAQMEWMSHEQRASLVEELCRSGAINGVELQRSARDGRRFTCLYFGEKITVAGKQRLLLIALDVTEQRKLEAQLRHSQKLEAVGQLAGGVAHDFNNILCVISGYANLLQMGMEEEAPEREMLSLILAASDRAATLTRSLLAFSRKQEVRRGHANLNEVVQNIEKFLRMIIGEDVLLSAKFHHDSLPVFLDAGQFGQVLVNLATNARDAMVRGGTLSIETSLRLLDDTFMRTHGYGAPGRYAVVSVSDSGIGMDEATRSRIFDPFFTTKEVGKGTGLGLAIVYGIIKQHNGYVSVYSEPGKGTTFQIYLPVCLGSEDATGPSVLFPQVRRGTETILLAEDDPLVCHLMETILSQFGYQVIVAVNGRDAVEKFAAHQQGVDLVLLDLIMPELGGREASVEILRIKPEMRILFLSGYTPDIIQRRGDLDEGFEMVMKPVHPLELGQRVREILDRSCEGAAL